MSIEEEWKLIKESVINTIENTTLYKRKEIRKH